MKLLFALIGTAMAAAACGGDTSHWDSTPTPTALDATQAPASLTQVPGCTPRTYTVQPDDTMLGIAIKFDVELRTLVATNIDAITDPNVLAIGQVVKVPCPKATATPGGPAGTTTATATPVPP